MTEPVQCFDCVHNVCNCEFGLFPCEGFDCPEYEEVGYEEPRERADLI